jgi:hypothetical protein
MTGIDISSMLTWIKKRKLEDVRSDSESNSIFTFKYLLTLFKNVILFTLWTKPICCHSESEEELVVELKNLTENFGDSVPGRLTKECLNPTISIDEDVSTNLWYIPVYSSGFNIEFSGSSKLKT